MIDNVNTITALKKVESLVKSILKAQLTASFIRLGELTIEVEKDEILQVLSQLKDHGDLQFIQLLDICGVDYPIRVERFEVVYQLLSLKHNLRVRVKVCVGDGEGVPSVISLFNSAGWWEREIWDLYGIPFSGHPDLRRILTDYGFEGHPLRKDFPLTGFVELRYDEVQQRIVSEPVELMQAFRTFDFLSPWEGPNFRMLPGDEKAVLDKEEA